MGVGVLTERAVALSLSYPSFSLSKLISLLGVQGSALYLKILYAHYPLRSVDRRSPLSCR